MKKTAILIMVIALVSKILGFTREIALSYYYGASNISDAYLISLTIPGTIFAFIAAGIATGYIPLYTEIEKNNSRGMADRFTSNILNLILIISIALIIFVLLRTTFVVKLFAPGFDGDTLNLAVMFTKVSVIGIFFYGISHVLKGYLQLKGKFVIPALLGIPFNLTVVGFIIISSTYNDKLLPLGIVIAMILEFFILYPFVYILGYKHRFHINTSNEYTRKMMYISIPVIFGASINQINTLIDRSLASKIIEGGVSALNYASRLNLFMQGIIVLSIATVIFPVISKMAAGADINGLREKVTEGLIGVSILLIPSSIGLMIFAKPIIVLLFGRGAFDSNAILLTSSALLFYSIGMVSMGYREILSKAFFAMKDSRTPMVNAAIGVLVNILLNLILSKFFGISGLALATSISAIVTASLMFVSFKKKITLLDMSIIRKSSMKILTASLIMGVVSKVIYNSLLKVFSEEVALIFAVVTAIIIYLLNLFLLKLEEIKLISDTVKSKLIKRKS